VQAFKAYVIGTLKEMSPDARELVLADIMAAVAEVAQEVADAGDGAGGGKPKASGGKGKRKGKKGLPEAAEEPAEGEAAEA
jgi:hypothetical protein